MTYSDPGFSNKSKRRRRLKAFFFLDITNVPDDQ